MAEEAKKDKIRRGISVGIIMLFASAIVFLSVVYNAGIWQWQSGNDSTVGVREYSAGELVPMPPYLLKQCGSYIGIFVFGEEEPFAYIDTNVETLPKLDRAMLKVGIKIETKSELAEAVEDFS